MSETTEREHGSGRFVHLDRRTNVESRVLRSGLGLVTRTTSTTRTASTAIEWAAKESARTTSTWRFFVASVIKAT